MTIKKRLQSSRDRREFIKNHIIEEKVHKRRERKETKKRLYDAYDRAMNGDEI